MRIRTRIAAFVIALMALVVASITLNLAILEQRRVRRESAERVDALLDGVQRIARESLSSADDLMLLSYLKFLMRDYPEMELAVVTRQGHTSVLGEARGPLDYRSFTLTEEASADLQPVPVAAIAPRAERGPAARQALPPHALSLQMGFSKAGLERRVAAAQAEVASKVLGMASLGLVVGLLGAAWVSARLSKPVAELARAADRLGEGRLDASVPAQGRDEISALGRRFNAMAASIRDLVCSKDELMSTLSHELNTPLAGLKGFLGYLRRPEVDADPAERAEAYGVMTTAVGQLESSLKNALLLFQTGAGLTARPETVDLASAVSEALKLFGPAARFSGIKLLGPASGASVPIEADPELIRRVVINLVSNAVKYTPSGGRVAVEALDAGAEAVLTVSDTGPGIAAEDREKVFQRFFRVDDATGRRTRIPGSGLGLAIAKQAVELHNGSIRVESEPGQGSRFIVRLPKKFSRRTGSKTHQERT
ncbi:MAG: HAMP domain-containing sensor histidine kinase [Elusimicrobiota bacterium]|jgi:signal transduction histidine kinase